MFCIWYPAKLVNFLVWYDVTIVGVEYGVK
jgi:hypothetical protein